MWNALAKIVWDVLSYSLCLGPFIVALTFVVVTTIQLGKNHTLPLLLLAIVPVSGSLFSSVIIGFTFWNAFGPGALLCFSSLGAGPFAFLLAIVGLILILVRAKSQTLSKGSLISYIATSCIILPSSCLASPFIGSAIMSECDSLHQARGNEIVVAMKDYQRDNTIYPQDIQQLVPSYLSSTPRASCFSVHSWLDQLSGHSDNTSEYELITCNDEALVLTVPTMEGAQFQRYNFASGVWSISVGDSIDDAPLVRVCNQLQ